jgi:ACS family tartrate transporter-like MFS transporter
MDLEHRTIARVTRRLVPFLMLCYFVAYLDRVNVGFAALEMNKDLQFSALVFSQGAGIFFLAYLVFEVPSNLLLERFGARKWIARIMVTWGVISAAMALVVGWKSFYAVRLLLGVAEAGFFPGIVFYLTLWFPAAYRGRIIGYFMAAIPLSSVIGAPVSGYLLGLDGVMGLRGWQWLYLLEALPAVVLGVVTYLYLTDRPADAHWLAPDERAWLAGRLEAERRQREQAEHFSVLRALTNPRVLALSFVYFGCVSCIYGLGFFLPQIIKAFGLSNAQTGWVTLIPFAVGAVAMVYWGHRSDARQERKYHLVGAFAISVVGLVGAAMTDDPYLKMAAFCVASFGTFSILPVFWTLPTAFLSGAAAAGGIAAINSLGNISGYVGPTIMGWAKDNFGSFNAGLLVIAGLGVLAAGTVMLLQHDSRLERPGALPAE